jgi:tetratricopeptide (TPR) repeat protein
MHHIFHYFAQGNYAEAERQIKTQLQEDPDDAVMHWIYGLCLVHLEDYKKALKEAQTSVALDPEDPQPYYVMAIAHASLAEHDKAMTAIHQALKINPYNEDYYSVLSMLYANKGQWQKSLEAAEKGLEIDAEDETCANARMRALVKLNRLDEAGEGFKATLAENPEDAETHANMGWMELEYGDRNQAMEHFREALRLDPNSNYAREGILMALRSRNVLYRGVLKWFFWMSHLTQAQAWTVIIGLYFFSRVIGGLANSGAPWAPFLAPLEYSYLIFVLATWMATPLVNMTLFLHPLGRLALNDREKQQAALLALCLVVALPAWGWFFYDKNIFAMRLGLIGLGSGMSVCGVFSQYLNVMFRYFAVFSVVMLAIGLVAIGLSVTGSVWSEAAFLWYLVVLMGFELMIVFNQ